MWKEAIAYLKGDAIPVPEGIGGRRGQNPHETVTVKPANVRRV